MTLLDTMERKESVKKIRRSGYVPGSMYGPGVDRNIEIQIDERQIDKFLKSHSIGAKIKIKVDEGEHLCIIKNIQYEPISKKPLHIEFYTSSENRMVKTKVPIIFKGHEQLSWKHLVLNILKDEIELQGRLKDLPEFVDVDVSSMTAGSVVTMGDIVLPEGIRLLSKTDEAVVSITEISSHGDEESADNDTSTDESADKGADNSKE